MGNLPRLVRDRKKSRVLGEPEVIQREDYEDLDLDMRLELIQALIPLGLVQVYEELDREVVRLAGARYRREPGGRSYVRHGSNRGSVKLAGQRVPVRVPRVRGSEGERRLESYSRLREGGRFNELLFRRVLYGLSCRNYEAAAESIPGAIGLSKSTVSRQFIEASSKSLRELQERDLSDLDVVAMVLDGKTFAEETMVVALGITLEGKKVFLGFVETATENERVLTQFLRSFLDRGLDISEGVLAVIDGSKGLRAAVLKAFRGRSEIHRCQWHKRENVVAHLPKAEQPLWRRRLQKAYERPTYEEAKKQLLEIRSQLDDINQSAVRSLDEGFEETLTLHRLGVFAVLGRSLKTTNCLESINSQIEERCAKVDHWKTSNQRHRWLAAALLDTEPRLRKILGYRHLPKLREALMKKLKIERRMMKKAA